MGEGGNDYSWGEMGMFTMMMMTEGATIALTIMAKTIMTRGLSPFVFIAYTNALGSILLLPYSFFFHRERPRQPIFTRQLLLRCFLMGFTGIFLSQNLAFVGLSYSSPIVVCAMGLMIPAFSFLLSVALRKTELDFRRSSTRAKITGTLVSFGGALVVELYKGPFIRKSSSSTPSLQFIPQLFVYYKPQDNWVLGGILLAAASLCVSIWNIIQLGTVKKYPQVMKVASFYSLAGSIQCVMFSLFMERDPSAWKLNLNLDLFIIVLTAIYVSIVRSSIHVSCTRKKGPFYVPLFKPFGIVFATTFGVSFFTNSLHYGSVLGAIIAGMGYYIVMLGQIREVEAQKEGDVEGVKSIFPEKVPLLQEDSQV